MAFISSAMILLLGITITSCAPPFYAQDMTLIALCIGRFLVGIGVGGEYPLAATFSGTEGVFPLIPFIIHS